MNIQELTALHAEVSVEFNNPFAKLNAAGLMTLKNFLDTASRAAGEALRGVDKTHPNGILGRTEDIRVSVKEKEVVYSDWGYLTVFCPSFLKKGVPMVSLAAHLEECLDLSVLIEANAPEEVNGLFRAYLGNLSRLNDPSPVRLAGNNANSLMVLETRVTELKAETAKLITSTGHSMERPYSQLYRRNEDYYQTNDIAVKCNAHYAKLTYTLKGYMERCDQANLLAKDLLDNIAKDPTLQVSPLVAKHLTDTMYQLGNLTAWMASVLYNTQYLLKSVEDTNTKIRRVLAQ